MGVETWYFGKIMAHGSWPRGAGPARGPGGRAPGLGFVGQRFLMVFNGV